MKNMGITCVFLALVFINSGCNVKVASTISTSVNLYIGTYTNNGSQGIYKALFDTITGAITNDTLVATLTNPSFINISANRQYLASVSEESSRASMLYTFEIHPVTGHLTPLSVKETGGYGPCYVSILADTVVCTANYSSGSVCFTQSSNTGELKNNTQCFNHQGQGPNTSRQEKPHAHNVIPDLDGEYIYSADLGADKLYVYKATSTQIIKVKEIEVEKGAGPRHIAFHPQKQLMAVVNELTPAVELYKRDDDGIFSIKCHSTLLLPDTITGGNTAADIHFSPDGKFVYATNRGFDFIAVLSVDSTNDTLTLVERVHGQLNWPRNFVIEPMGRFVLVANQKGNNIVVFKRDAQSGRLTDTGYRLNLDSPVCLQF